MIPTSVVRGLGLCVPHFPQHSKGAPVSRNKICVLSKPTLPASLCGSMNLRSPSHLPAGHWDTRHPLPIPCGANYGPHRSLCSPFNYSIWYLQPLAVALRWQGSTDRNIKRGLEDRERQARRYPIFHFSLVSDYKAESDRAPLASSASHRALGPPQLYLLCLGAALGSSSVSATRTAAPALQADRSRMEHPLG